MSRFLLKGRDGGLWRRLVFVGLFVGSVGSRDVGATEIIFSDGSNFGVTGNVTGYGGVCSAGSLPLCGVSLSVPAGYLGEVRTLSLPERFQTTSVVVQCVRNAHRTYYQIIGAGDSVCALKKCAPSDVSLCERAVPVSLSLAVGEAGQVVVPSSLLAGAFAPPSFSVRCALSDGVARYEVKEASSVSCNIFACQPAQIPICGGLVSVGRGAALGEVFHLKTDLNQSVTVQCLGSGAQAPRFVVVNNNCS